MRKTLSFLLFTFMLGALKAQVYKTFLNNGATCDSASATSYIVYSQAADSAWRASQFTLEGNIIFKASYKDPGLQILHGFAYYYSKADSGKYFVSQKGAFINGLKEGIWAEYFHNGRLKLFYTYQNDKMHGAFEMYSPTSDNPYLKGEYANGLREGKWHMIGKYGDTLSTETFKEGHFVKIYKYPPSYKAPALSKEFSSFMAKNLAKSLADNKNAGNILIICGLTQDGKIYDPKILGRGFNNIINAEALWLLPLAPACQPAYSNKERRSIKDSITFYLHIDRRSVSTELKRYRITNTSDSISKDALEDTMPEPPGGDGKILRISREKY